MGHEREVIRYMTRLAGASLDETGCELTHFATRGEFQRVKSLVESHGLNPNGIEPNKNESNLIPVIAAAKIGNLEMVKLLIENGAELNRSEINTKTNITHAVAQHGHLAVMKYLIEIIPKEGLITLLNAQAGFQIDALSSASDWLIFRKRRFDWLRVSPRKHQFENPSQDAEGRTAARIAAWEGHHNIIKLIGPYSKLNQSDFEDRTPLFAACYMQHIDTVVQVNQINLCTVPLK